MSAPSQIIVVRHAESELNELYRSKREDSEYRMFSAIYEVDSGGPAASGLAHTLKGKYGGKISDPYADITDLGVEQARGAAEHLRQTYEVPDVVFISTYKRTRRTYEEMVKVWPELGDVILVEDDLLREQELGEVNLYGDFNIFLALNEKERMTFDMLGFYFYRFPGGENIPDLRQRVGVWLDKVSGSQYAGKKVFVVSHFTTIIAMRANIEGWGSEKFTDYYENMPRINCAVSEFRPCCRNGMDTVAFNRAFDERP